MKVEIRPATLADIPATASIDRPAVLTGTASFELEPPGEDEMRRRWEAIAAGGFPYLVAQSGERVVGYGYASAYRTRPAYRFSVENSVYIAPDCYRQGLGRKLLQALIAEGTQRGFPQMIAVIGDSRQRASIGLHCA